MARCLALAKGLAALSPDISPLFVLDRDGVAWCDAVQASGFKALLDGETLPDNVFGVVLDGYHFAETEIARFKVICGRGGMVVIDDFSTPPREADLVVNSGCHMKGDQLNGIPALLGPRYALLDAVYETVEMLNARDRVENILVSFGRVDSKNVTLRTLHALSELFGSEGPFVTTVVLGAQAPNRALVEAFASDYPGPLNICYDVEDMKRLLAQADLVIGGGGVSLLERMAMGKPSVTVVQATNQADNVAGAAQIGGTVSAGFADELALPNFTIQLQHVMDSQTLRADMSGKARAAVDGMGVRRVADHMMQSMSQGYINV
jgi:UDP-2,4-diacetamido-2,4,6-trideoxy-beta-L-altropyranose hydrolase